MLVPAAACFNGVYVLAAEAPDAPPEEIEVIEYGSAFKRREVVVEARSLYNTPEVVERSFDSDWKRIQRGPDNLLIEASVGLKKDPSSVDEISKSIALCSLCCVLSLFTASCCWSQYARCSCDTTTS